METNNKRKKEREGRDGRRREEAKNNKRTKEREGMVEEMEKIGNKQQEKEGEGRNSVGFREKNGMGRRRIGTEGGTVYKEVKIGNPNTKRTKTQANRTSSICKHREKLWENH